jgi:hypothetical protein
MPKYELYEFYSLYSGNLFKQLLLVDTHYDHLLIINWCLWHFTLKLEKIFHFLQEKFKKINFVLLFNFTSYMYFWPIKSYLLIWKLLILRHIGASTLQLEISTSKVHSRVQFYIHLKSPYTMCSWSVKGEFIHLSKVSPHEQLFIYISNFLSICIITLLKNNN